MTFSAAARSWRAIRAATNEGDGGDGGSLNDLRMSEPPNGGAWNDDAVWYVDRRLFSFASMHEQIVVARAK